MFPSVLLFKNAVLIHTYPSPPQDPDAVPKSNLMKAASVGSLYQPENTESSSPDLRRARSGSTRSTKSEKSEYGQETYSMMEFAMHNFRHGQ